MRNLIDRVNTKPLEIHGDSGNDLQISDISLSLELNPSRLPQMIRLKKEDKDKSIKIITPKTGPESGTGSSLFSSNPLKLKKGPFIKHSRGATMATIKDKLINKLSLSNGSNVCCKLCKLGSNSQLIYQTLYNKYERATQNTYNINTINDLLINSNSHATAIFKDYLVFDDLTENIRALFRITEAKNAIMEHTKIYSKKIRPNYFIMEEKKFIFKNIEKKNKMRITKEAEVNHKKSSTVMSKGIMEEFINKATKVPPQVVAKMDMIGMYRR